MAKQVEYTKGLIGAKGGVQYGVDAVILSFAGVPVDGVSGTGVGVAGRGSLVSDTVNGKLYINTGTITSPTWIVVGTQV